MLKKLAVGKEQLQIKIVKIANTDSYIRIDS